MSPNLLLSKLSLLLRWKFQEDMKFILCAVYRKSSMTYFHSSQRESVNKNQIHHGLSRWSLSSNSNSYYMRLRQEDKGGVGGVTAEWRGTGRRDEGFFLRSLEKVCFGFYLWSVVFEGTKYVASYIKPNPCNWICGCNWMSTSRKWIEWLYALYNSDKERLE